MVRATYAERPKQDLMRMDAFEIVWSPLREALDWERTAGLQLMAEVLEEALPEQAVDDAVFRLAAAVLPEMQVGRVELPVSYFCLWVTRLMGWMPELRRCAACGVELREEAVWWSPAADGVVCADDQPSGGVRLPPEVVRDAQRMFRSVPGSWRGRDGRGAGRNLCCGWAWVCWSDTWNAACAARWCCSAEWVAGGSAMAGVRSSGVGQTGVSDALCWRTAQTNECE